MSELDDNERMDSLRFALMVLEISEATQMLSTADRWVTPRPNGLFTPVVDFGGVRVRLKTSIRKVWAGRRVCELRARGFNAWVEEGKL